MHDEAFRGDAGFAVIDEAGSHGGFYGGVKVAGGRTIKGSEPPSSKTDFLMSHPACAPMALPAATEPVRVTAAMRGSARIRST